MMSLQFQVILTQPKKQTASPQLDMFRSRLANILDHGRPLRRLSGLIGWDAFEREFGELYSEEGRPGIPISMMVGLTCQSRAFIASDEETVRRWVENPHHQYFCGEEHFRHAFPIDQSSLWQLAEADRERGR